jgi:predicted nucleic acid-binding protein
LIFLIDTDVLIDVAMQREPHVAASAGLLSAIEQRRATGFVAWHSLSNLHYLLRPTHGSRAAKEFLRDLLLFVDVAQTSTAAAAYAIGLPLRDFEDALQVAAAAASGADMIATRNIRDYAGSPVKADTPANLLQRLR